MWRRSKLKNKIWHFGHYTHIALLKRTPKKGKIGYSVYIYKATRIHSETILPVSPEWTTTVLSDKLEISLRPSKINLTTRLDILRDVIVQISSIAIWLVSRVLQIETIEIVNYKLILFRSGQFDHDMEKM